MVTSFLQKDIAALESIQKFALYHAWGMAYQELIGISSLPTLEERRVVMRLCLLYQILNGYIYFNQNTFTHSISLSHRLLHSMTLSHPFCRTNCFKYSFVPFTINLWNNLEHTIVSTPTPPSCFKYRLVHSCNSCLALAIICYVHVFLSFMTNYYHRKMVEIYFFMVETISVSLAISFAYKLADNRHNIEMESSKYILSEANREAGIPAQYRWTHC